MLFFLIVKLITKYDPCLIDSYSKLDRIILLDPVVNNYITISFMNYVYSKTVWILLGDIKYNINQTFIISFV